MYMWTYPAANGPRKKVQRKTRKQRYNTYR